MRRNPREDPRRATNRQDRPTRGPTAGGQPGQPQSGQPPAGTGQPGAGPPPSGQGGAPPGAGPQQRQPQPAPPQQYGQPPAQMQPPQTPQQGMGGQPAGQPPGQPAGQPAGQPTGQPTGQPQGGGRPARSGQPPGGQPLPGTGTQQAGRVAEVRPRLRPVSIEEIVQSDVVTAERDTPVATVVAMMAEEDVGSVVVVEDDAPVGIITDRNVALSLEEAPDVSERRAEEVMVGDLVTTTTDATVFDVIHTLGDAGVRRLPVVDEDGRLAGIVALDDVLVVLTGELETAADILRAQMPQL